MADANELEEVVVTASLRQQTLAEIPVSITVLDESTLEAVGLQHFEDVLGLVPNLNWSGGTSRPRFFQVRGIGELEQYQGAPNPSVGFLIDDIDLSGVGMPATLFDAQQVEVLRGPQGTRLWCQCTGRPDQDQDARCNAPRPTCTRRSWAPTTTPGLRASRAVAHSVSVARPGGSPRRRLPATASCAMCTSIARTRTVAKR